LIEFESNLQNIWNNSEIRKIEKRKQIGKRRKGCREPVWPQPRSGLGPISPNLEGVSLPPLSRH
jgi:hypothetical protein